MYKGQSNKYKLIKYLRKVKVEEVLDRAKRVNKRDYLIMLTLWKTGMRCNELTHLKKKDIREDEIIIRMGKGSKPRMLPLDPTLDTLLGFHSSNMVDDDLLFPISNTAVRNLVHKYQGDVVVTPHTFRHSFAVHCLKQGVNIRALQILLGHTSLETTAIYLEIVGQDIKDEYKKIEW